MASSPARLEQKDPEGFEDRPTFRVKNRNWPGTSFASNVDAGDAVITTADYIVNVPQGATSLPGTYRASPSGQMLYQYNGWPFHAS